MKASNRVSNLEECVEKAINFSSKLPSKWPTADYTNKQQIQFLFFPEGIRYNRQIDKCRTTRVNSVFAYIAHLKQDLIQQKRGIPELNLDYASLVEGTGEMSNSMEDFKLILTSIIHP